MLALQFSLIISKTQTINSPLDINVCYMTVGEAIFPDYFFWLLVASYGLVAFFWLKWPQRTQQHRTNSHVQQSPSGQVRASFETPCVTLHTGNWATETTDGNPRKTSSHSLHFLFPPRSERFIAILQQALWSYTYPLHSPFSLCLLWHHLPSPLLSVLSIISDHSAEVIVMETLIKQFAL